MPTKKRRVGFIPRSNVLDLINKLSFENNLSNSKIINILVEEALYKRGLFDMRSDKVIYADSKINENTKVLQENIEKKFSIDFKNDLLNQGNLYTKEWNKETLDKEIYSKFIMFLQFQEQMKKLDS